MAAPAPASGPASGPAGGPAGGPDGEVLGRARKLAPLLRAHAAEAERTRRLHPEVVGALRQAGLFGLYVPRSLGGLEADPVTVAAVAEEVSLHDASAGWQIMVANTLAFWGARLPAPAYREVWGRPGTYAATAFYPPVEAAAADGGYRLTGRRSYASGIHDASWLMLLGIVSEGGQPVLRDGQPQVFGAFLPAGEARVHDTWQALGMRGTDSQDVEVSGAFVPAHRTFPVVPGFEPNELCSGPLYRVPAMGPALGAIIPPVALGIARGAISEYQELARGKVPFPHPHPLRDRGAGQAAVGEAEALVRSARALLFGALDEAWRRALDGKAETLEQKNDLFLAAVHAVQASARAVELVHGAAGTTAVLDRSPLQRHFRDIQTVRTHGFVNAARYETAGQVLLGLPPDLAFVGF